MSDKPNRHGQMWTIKEIDRLLEMVDKGKQVSVIAAKLERTEGSVRSMISRQRGLLIRQESRFADECCSMEPWDLPPVRPSGDKQSSGGGKPTPNPRDDE